MHGRRHIGPGRATRAIVALVAAVACLGSVAYAAIRPSVAERKGDGTRHPSRARDDGPPRPRFIEVPPSGGILTDVQFRFHVPPPPQPAGRPGPGPGPTPPAQWRRFQCRFDGADWSACSSPARFAGLEPGDHAFAVRALNRRGQPGLPAHYRWAQLQPQNFTIDSLATLEELMPGAPAQQLPVRIGNPNPVPIEVTALTVAATPDAPACPGETNFAVTPSNVSSATPLSIPAGGSVSLPTASATAPTLALRELPSDQNACQGATVHLDFRGEARG
ncbi:MAG TPA: hypothetical protein VHP56_03475 [Solirubrobacterales bacterium]|jgi:hypothetical protein|nr:hypothetical protein [Solirubrobacterales bacterium]